MSQVLLIVHLMVALALIVSVLLQRSEGGGLGIGGGGGGMVSSRGTGNFLTKITAILAATFMATSLTLAILASQTSQPTSIIQQIPLEGQAPAQMPADPAVPLD